MADAFKAHHMFHAEHDPVLVTTPDQKQKLGPGWSDRYIHKTHPLAMGKVVGTQSVKQPDGSVEQVHKILEKLAKDADHEAELRAQGFVPRVELEPGYEPPPEGALVGAASPALLDENARLKLENDALKAQLSAKDKGGDKSKADPKAAKDKGGDKEPA